MGNLESVAHLLLSRELYSDRLRDAFRSPNRTWRVLVLVVVAAYLVFARTRGTAESFYLLRDQIRDWRFALGPFSQLPLTGTPSTAGGASLGPIYYWILWASRVLIGPWTGNMPHAGAIGIAIFHTAADLLLLESLRRYFQSFWLATATVLLVATIAHDLALSATIWNPSVSIALVKIALAMLLVAGSAPSALWAAATTGVAWLAVQAHSSAIFVAAPVAGAFVVRDLAARRFREGGAKVRAIVETILVLQIPFLYSAFTAAGEAAPTRAIGGVSQALTDPDRLRLSASFHALVHFSGRLFVIPWDEWWWGAALAVAAVIALVRLTRDLTLTAATLMPLACAVLGFALWQGNYDEYWYMPLTPSVAILIGAALTVWRRDYAGVILLIAVAAIQPWRLAHAQLLYRMPEYAALSRGSRIAARQSPVVSRFSTTFRLDPLCDPGFLYEVAGGRQDPSADFAALIDESGSVHFVPTR